MGWTVLAKLLKLLGSKLVSILSVRTLTKLSVLASGRVSLLGLLIVLVIPNREAFGAAFEGRLWPLVTAVGDTFGRMDEQIALQLGRILTEGLNGTEFAIAAGIIGLSLLEILWWYAGFDYVYRGWLKGKDEALLWSVLWATVSFAAIVVLVRGELPFLGILKLMLSLEQVLDVERLNPWFEPGNSSVPELPFEWGNQGLPVNQTGNASTR